MGVGNSDGGWGSYLFFFVALLAKVLAAASHFGAAHSVFFGRQVLFRLRFCQKDD